MTVVLCGQSLYTDCFLKQWKYNTPLSTVLFDVYPELWQIPGFFWYFAKSCVLIMHKTWPSPIFEKKFFPAENAGNMPEKLVFGHLNLISWDFIISFFHFFVKRCILAMLITWPSPIFDKNFLPAENAGNPHFCRFSSDFSLIFRCFFT